MAVTRCPLLLVVVIGLDSLSAVKARVMLLASERDTGGKKPLAEKRFVVSG